MVYKINVANVKKLDPQYVPKGLVATVTLDIDNILKISGICIKEKEDGMLYVEMPKRQNVYSRSVMNSSSKYIAIPSSKEFAKELYSNIIKTYVKGEHELNVDIGEPEQTHYKINAYPSDKRDCEGIINLELEDSIKIRGMRLIKSDGDYSIECPVNSNDYLNWQLPSVHFIDNDFMNHILENSVSMINEVRTAAYTQEDKNEYIKIEKGIHKEESDIKLCESMSLKICNDLGVVDDTLEAGDVTGEEKDKLLSKQKYLTDMLGQFAYAYYVAENNIKKLDKQKNELMDKYDSERDDKDKAPKRKVGAGR